MSDLKRVFKSDSIKIDGPDFKDDKGRILTLRGVNLGGSSKMPFTPDGATYLRENFYRHRNLSFVGRPFPLEEADEHFARLKSWGFRFLRFLVTWEAIEHQGPGIYDLDYIAYIRAILEKANQYDIRVVIDPHQDVWSRFSGGDGAPGWTFELVGFDIKKFQQTGAAFTHQAHGDPLPQMIWSTNATKLAASTMFTLFFGGRDFAPKTKIDGIRVQEFLQQSYIQSLIALADGIKDLPNVVGYDTMNEPVDGYIGMIDLNQRYTTVEKGFVPTPFQSMILGSGKSLELEIWERGFGGPKVIGKKICNSDGESVWLDGFDPIWQIHGVWADRSESGPELLQPEYFYRYQGKIVDFNRDYYIPFNNRFAESIRKVQSKLMIFVEKGFRGGDPIWQEGDASNIVYAPHWYDPVVLVMKLFNRWINYDRRKKKIIFGPKIIKRSFSEQLKRPKDHAREHMGNVPVIIGEVGIAYDLDGKKAYRTGDYSAQIKAYNRTLEALESNLHHFTLWNYTADNSNQRGDHWNDEDLSIFSRDQQKDTLDINSGGRALEAVIRPYPLATAGYPLEIRFDPFLKAFVFRFKHNPQVDGPTIIYLPSYHYPLGCEVDVSDGKWELNKEDQELFYWHTPEVTEHKIRVTPKK
ncbi:MAG: cellulase family glycosylhydrolase [Chloroflexi bacterium]|nr:cellulase family glycosylhydrolase [Chloroflexota bacterium]